MAAVDVQHPMEATYVPAGPLKRSESQVLKQMKVEQVQQRLFHQQEPVRKLLDETDSLLSAAAVDRAAALEVIEQQQKAARNIGEDLMEDMLCLDSLANLFQEDRQVRKKALADIEALVEQVDSAKSMLMKRRKELEALAHADTEAAPLAPAAASAAPAAKPTNERLAEIRLPLELTSQSLPHAYVVSGFARGLKKEDLTLELRGSTLKINALRLPSPEESAFLERSLRRAPTVEDFMALGRGVFGQIREAIKLPTDVERSRIQATCVDGQLRITLPRQPRRPQFSW
mmetsp:Transcript_40776/g.64179  ORF Transcript_40776/g.64179 Transcript_40776/m.64179 type:complete len:287 (-) Transcript_40776:79-939(-)